MLVPTRRSIPHAAGKSLKPGMARSCGLASKSARTVRRADEIVFRLPQREQTSRLAQSGTSISAPSEGEAARLNIVPSSRAEFATRRGEDHHNGRSQSARAENLPALQEFQCEADAAARRLEHIRLPEVWHLQRFRVD